MGIPGAPFETGTSTAAQAVSRPPCGGGSGWGVAPRSPIWADGVDSRKSMARPPSLALPHKAGLSHMNKEFEEEFFFPTGEFHFACHGAVVGVGL